MQHIQMPSLKCTTVVQGQLSPRSLQFLLPGLPDPRVSCSKHVQWLHILHFNHPDLTLPTPHAPLHFTDKLAVYTKPCHTPGPLHMLSSGPGGQCSVSLPLKGILHPPTSVSTGQPVSGLSSQHPHSVTSL
jgi:hypothetical protein